MSIKQAFQDKKSVQEYDIDAKPMVDVNLSRCSKKDRPRMIALINRLAQSEKGKETLEIAAKGGFKLEFISGNHRAFGYCAPGSKVVALNPSSPDEKLVGTLCHECRHAGQFIRGREVESCDFDVRSQLIYYRGMEADAQTYAVMACEELARQGDEGPKKEFYKYYPEIAKAFDGALEKNKNELGHRLMTDTFEGWYDQKGTKTVYEEGYQLDPMRQELRNLKMGFSPSMEFKDSIKCEDAIRLLTWTKDGNYFKDEPKILETGKYLDVSETSMKEMKTFFKLRQDLTGLKPDKSLESIPTRADTHSLRGPAMNKVRKPRSDKKQGALSRILNNKQQHQNQGQFAKIAAIHKQINSGKFGR